MGAFLSNASFEQPGANAIAAFVVERNKPMHLADSSTSQFPEKSKQLPSSRPSIHSKKLSDRPATADDRREGRQPPKVPTATTSQTSELPVPPLPMPVSSKKNRTRSTSSQMPVCSSVPDIPIPSPPVPRVRSKKGLRSKSMVRPPTVNSQRAPPRHRTVLVRPTTTKGAQSHLLGELYSLDIPATEIALMVRSMRGDITEAEETALLQRLYALSVPSLIIAQVIDAMRAGRTSQAETIIPDDAPPMYEGPL